MFAKLLKHDIKSVWRLWWLLLPILPAASLLMSFAIRYMQLEEQMPEPFALGMVIATLITMLSFVAIVGSMIYTLVLVFTRFYKHLYTDEGYLTFTLPIKRSTILFSKSLNAMIWLVAHVVLFVICILTVMLIAPLPENGAWIDPIIFVELGEIFADIWNEIGAWLILYIFELIVLGLIGIAFAISLFQFCITFAATLVRRAKLFLGIGIYYAVNAIISSIGSVMFYVTFLSTFYGATELLEDMSKAQSCIFIAVLLLAVGAAMSLFTSVFYLASRNCMERKLNLA